MGRAELLKYQHSCITLIISDNTWRGGDVECVCGGGGDEGVCVELGGSTISVSCVSSGGEHHHCELCVEWGGGGHQNQLAHQCSPCEALHTHVKQWDMEMAFTA